jgi:hypothetical protein
MPYALCSECRYADASLLGSAEFTIQRTRNELYTISRYKVESN